MGITSVYEFNRSSFGLFLKPFHRVSPFWGAHDLIEQAHQFFRLSLRRGLGGGL